MRAPPSDPSTAPERDPADLRQFARGVDWKAAERSKELYWRDWKRRHGPAAGIRIADDLRRQACAQNPSFPTEEARREDHASHLRELEAFDRFDAWRSAPPR